ncbi:uncharacterized protein BDZ99DRAFT_468743 [Mytilinidion resinicola]|uniref:Uncharacterized protein n=1 Tax=Mytilinidion resinicola TaxID=574789 RepID=A0A6A6Y4R8_9PEZI|nr:uncharacterized protein BDZ99DRAFT_468743 [Mytilinidion resinicola]KAF2802787.1 hypothetical protein BDZ99DRAFT_468743 [Mytilinidion resinicola]
MNFEPPPTGQLPLPEFSLPFRPHRPPPRPVQASPSFSLPIRPRAAPRNPAHIEAEPISTTPAHAAVATESNSKDPTQWLQYGGLWHQVGSFAVATSIADPTLPVTPQVEEDVLRAVVRSAERRAVAQALKPQPQPPQTQAEKKRNRWKGSKSFVPRPMGQELVNFTSSFPALIFPLRC